MIIKISRFVRPFVDKFLYGIWTGAIAKAHKLIKVFAHSLIIVEILISKNDRVDDGCNANDDSGIKQKKKHTHTHHNSQQIETNFIYSARFVFFRLALLYIHFHRWRNFARIITTKHENIGSKIINLMLYHEY